MANSPIFGSYGEELIKEDQIINKEFPWSPEDEYFNKENLWNFKDTSSISRNQEIEEIKEFLKIMEISDKTNDQITQELMDQLNFKPSRPILKAHNSSKDQKSNKIVKFNSINH
ncbi:hypothetical protein O181_009094 [Austropuccinia psidii MF-1]|uniref:Uncharacterized protein n=1 Tax=Austropuccinia psidii MF-1 TaxID=1389203 RepID=A0A9Q3BNP4_9BASI|nr:hypothetical protein [Austropuccinia psidii MF-1]